jgi:hypothetical protein
MTISSWSGLRIALIAVAWPIAVVGFMAWRLARLSGREGAAFVSAGVVEAMAILFGPPLILVAAWVISRVRA